MITDYITYLWGRFWGPRSERQEGGVSEWGMSEDMRFETQIQNIVSFIPRQRFFPLCSSVGLIKIPARSRP